METAEYRVTGMTCAHCERAVAAEVDQIPGITVTEVSAPTGRLRVISETAVEDARVLAAVDEAGYEAVRVQ